MKEKIAYSNWKVQQAMSIERAPIPKGEEFWITEKLNGVRASFYEGNLVYRSGRIARGLDHITNILREHSEYFFDGELTLINPRHLTNSEAFSKTAGILSSYTENKAEIGFTIFDCYPLNDTGLLYSERRKIMDDLPFPSYWFSHLSQGFPVNVLPVLYHGNDISAVQMYLRKAVDNDEEGIVVNLDRPYLHTRHSGVLKVKEFYTVDLKIVSCEEGKGRLRGTLGALIVSYKDNVLGVGTGFTDAERRVLWSMKDRLPGKLCEVRYKTITSDKTTGKESLQFPVFVRLRGDKNEESYD